MGDPDNGELYNYDPRQIGRNIDSDRINELGAVIRGERENGIDGFTGGHWGRHGRGGGEGGDSRVANYKSRREAFQSLVHDELERTYRGSSDKQRETAKKIWLMTLEVFPELYYEAYPEDKTTEPGN